MQLVCAIDYSVMLYDGENTSLTESISSFLDRWRRLFITDQRPRRKLTNHHDPIVLPPEPDDRVIDIIFHTDNTRAVDAVLHVRFVVSSLYCIAFSLDGTKWHEVLVNDTGTQIIPNSILVGSFTSTHASLNPSDCNISKVSLIHSVDLLAQYCMIYKANLTKKKKEVKMDQVDKNDLERAFGVIVTIFCEGARFRCLENSIARNFENFDGHKLGYWALNWIQNWLHISWILQYMDYYNKTSRFPAKYADSDEFEQDMEAQIQGMGLEIPGIGSIEGVENVRIHMAVMKYHN